MRILQHITALARQNDVPNLATGLLMVNTRAVDHLLESTNFYSWHTFVTPNDWKQIQDMDVPTVKIPLNNLVAANVHINNIGVLVCKAPIITLLLLLRNTLVDPDSGSIKGGIISLGTTGLENG